MRRFVTAIVTRMWINYRQARDTFISQLESLPDGATDIIVPLCPAWKLTDLVAHVCGLNADLVNGMRSGLGSDENTALQVAERSECTLAELLAEWRGYGPQVEALSGDIPDLMIGITGDLIVHIHDAQHALQLPIDRQIAGLDSAAGRYATQLEARVNDRIGSGIGIDLTDADRMVSDAPLSLSVSAYDFLRSVTGRRSRSQVEALSWTGDPRRVLDEAWSAYGPFQTEDISI